MIGMLLVALIGTAGVLASPSQEAAARGATSPFAGQWVADLSRSRLDAKTPLKAVDLNIAVDGNIVKLASSFTLASGQTMSETETLRADGTETPATLTPGLSHFANWVGPQVLALTTRKGNQNIALITYEVSADGQTLMARTSGVVDQMLVFRRR